MHAVQLATFGVENLQVEEVADPVAGPGEILVATDGQRSTRPTR
jgi:NADPH:quinone reductase-like Zn-dependent oxidoreductase